MPAHRVTTALVEPARPSTAHFVDRLYGAAPSTAPPAASRLSPTHTDARSWLALWSLLAGCVLGLLAREMAAPAEIARPALVGLAFIAGVLSTWSPCGYSSLSLLRPQQHVRHARGKWAVAFLMHGFGYLAGAVACGTVLGLVGYAFATAGYGRLDLLLLGIISVGYGLHQFGLIRMPYPERCAQVPHGAYAVVLDDAGVTRAMGVVNTREHLESLLIAKETGHASLQEYLTAKQAGQTAAGKGAAAPQHVH